MPIVTVTRAGFLKLCGLAFAGAGMDVGTLEAICTMPSAPAEVVRRAGVFRIEHATAAFFRDHLTTAFHLRAADGTRARLVLVEVSERRVTRNVEQFSLIFHAPPGHAVPDGIHRLEHAVLGPVDLFIVPVGARNARRTAYQACFSRLVEDVSHV